MAGPTLGIDDVGDVPLSHHDHVPLSHHVHVGLRLRIKSMTVLMLWCTSNKLHVMTAAYRSLLGPPLKYGECVPPSDASSLLHLAARVGARAAEIQTLSRSVQSCRCKPWCRVCGHKVHPRLSWVTSLVKRHTSCLGITSC